MQTELSSSLALSIAKSDAERKDAIRLLASHHLPTDDIDDDKILYLLKKEGKVIGTAGLELFDACALLRSVSVIKEAHGKGYGKRINDQLEAYAKESGIQCLYLLTTTAAGFFEKQGYVSIQREAVPEVIQQTAEFRSLCPATAVVMQKKL